MIELRNWSVTRRNDNPYLAPECRPYVLQGEVTGHPCLRDGKVTTSQVVSFDRQTLEATTASGSHYVLLGRPAKDWSAWLFANGFTIESFFDRLGE